MATLEPEYRHTVITATGLLKPVKQYGNVAPPGEYD